MDDKMYNEFEQVHRKWADRRQAVEQELDELENAIRDVQDAIDQKLPDMRGFAIAQTKLDEAVMWIRNEPTTAVLMALYDEEDE